MEPLILITRAQDHAPITQKDVEAIGYRTLLDPMLHISPLAFAGDISPATAALIITSRNGIHGLAGLAHAKEFPLFVVGEETAAQCRFGGFTNIKGVVKTSAELPAIIKAAIPPQAGHMLHITSQHAHTEFYDALLDAGYGIEQLLVYAADATQSLQSDTIVALRTGALWGAVFYSARTADVFMHLAAAAGVDASLAAVRAFCLSDAVAKTLQKTAWKAMHVAPQPTHAALMDVMRAHRAD